MLRANAELSIDKGRIHSDGLWLRRRPGDAGRVRLAPVKGSTAALLYPLQVAVEVDGRPIGSVTVPSEGMVDELLSLPPDLGDRDLIEVRLSPRTWGVSDDGPGGKLVSFRPLLLASVPSQGPR